ncbi:MAG: helix-turn-helix domain-containing protein [Peptoanaerobacter stomatis]|uniref:helix-turn-helix domain-containing protein n=1 Tax=Peptoanaerobacter stomatis TaxID=796937 RepID=UPI003F9F7732
MSTGQKIKQEREKQNLSQKELATKTNINVSVMNRIENSERAIRDDEILKIAKILNVTTDYLLGNETKNKEQNSQDKDEKDIAKSMKKIKEQLKDEQGLMFDGEPLDDTTIELLLEELERQERLVKKINKKYTPKKYLK